MEKKVIEVFSEATGKGVGELCPETRLEEDLELKSLDMFALLAMLEGMLGSAPDSDEAASMETIGDFIGFYERQS